MQDECSQGVVSAQSFDFFMSIMDVMTPPKGLLCGLLRNILTTISVYFCKFNNYLFFNKYLTQFIRMIILFNEKDYNISRPSEIIKINLIL